MSAVGYIDTNTGEYVASDPIGMAFKGLVNVFKKLFNTKSAAEKKLEELQRLKDEKKVKDYYNKQINENNGIKNIGRPKKIPYEKIVKDGRYHIVFDEKYIPDDINAPVDIELANFGDMLTIYNDLINEEDLDENIRPVSITFKDGSVIDENTQYEEQPPKPSKPSYNRFHPAHVLVTDDIPVDRTRKPIEPLENSTSIYAIIPIAIIFFAMT